MYNNLHECLATVRKSLEDLDYFVVEGGRAFTDITSLVDVLTTHWLLSETLRKQYQSLVEFEKICESRSEGKNSLVLKRDELKQ